MNQLATNSLCYPRGIQGPATKPARTMNTLSNTAFASMFAAACARRAAASTRVGGQ